jgi:hypothetical protein
MKFFQCTCIVKVVYLKIRVTIHKLKVKSQTNRYIHYSLQVDSEEKYYALHIADTSTGNATAGEDSYYSLHFNNGKNFTTVDVHHDGCEYGCVGCCSTKFDYGYFFAKIVLRILFSIYDISVVGGCVPVLLCLSMETTFRLVGLLLIFMVLHGPNMATTNYSIRHSRG